MNWRPKQPVSHTYQENRQKWQTRLEGWSAQPKKDLSENKPKLAPKKVISHLLAMFW